MSWSKFSTHEFNDDDIDGADWQNSYSDLVTDLLAIFVILFSFAMVNQAIVSYQTTNINQHHNQTGILTGTDGVFPEAEDTINVIQNATSSDQISSTSEQVSELQKSIEAYIDNTHLSDQLYITKEGDNNIIIRLSSSLLFESGSSTVNPNAEPILEKLSEILLKYDKSINFIRIEGHTDNVRMHSEEFDSNWELSSSRAVNVLRHILELSSLKPSKFSANGYGEYQPIAENDSSVGRCKNRRVDIYIETAP